ncbi:hypothetical protein ACFQY3_14225 [Paenibacillus farraposensis]|uniref:hypothetical protein n=1 Tax=Paenibacillus farraposensis TaxID=2807095 RepID=UPI003617F43D
MIILLLGQWPSFIYNDENDNTVMAVYPGASGDIFEGDAASVIGVPISNFLL